MSSLKGVIESSLVTPFKLDTAYRTTFRKDQPEVTTGYVVVFEVDKEKANMTALAHPVLYAGTLDGQTTGVVERLNKGYDSGRVVGIIPAPIEGKNKLDLKKFAAWFGGKELPVNITIENIKAEAAQAKLDGVAVIPAAEVDAAVKAGGTTVVKAADLGALLKSTVGPLVRRYSPDEAEVADAWDIPEGGRVEGSK